MLNLLSMIINITFHKSKSNKVRIQALSILHNPKVLNYHLDCLEEFQSIQSDTNFPRFEYIDLKEVIKHLKIENYVLSEDNWLIRIIIHLFKIN